MEDYSKLTKYLALDCEMVDIGLVEEVDIVARVSLVNERREVVYDKIVKPKQKVTNYRTAITGLRERDLEKGVPFEQVQKDVKEMIEGRIVVGHSVHYDFNVLQLNHPRGDTRDTAKYLPFIKMNNNRWPSLKFLAQRLLYKNIQTGVHSSVEDARTVMQVYQKVAVTWENLIKTSSKAM